jgi:hypothetical protein
MFCLAVRLPGASVCSSIPGVRLPVRDVLVYNEVRPPGDSAWLPWAHQVVCQRLAGMQESASRIDTRWGAPSGAPQRVSMRTRLSLVVVGDRCDSRVVEDLEVIRGREQHGELLITLDSCIAVDRHRE